MAFTHIYHQFKKKNLESLVCLAATPSKLNTRARARGKPLQVNHECDFIGVTPPIFCSTTGVSVPFCITFKYYCGVRYKQKGSFIIFTTREPTLTALAAAAPLFNKLSVALAHFEDSTTFMQELKPKLAQLG